MIEKVLAKKRALVTGSTGYVGSNLVRGLLDDGWQVEAVVRPSSSFRMLLDIKNRITIYVFKGGIQQLSEIVAKASPDVVFHVASMVVGEHESEQVDTIISSNIIFGSLLLEAMSNLGIYNFVNTGTYWEHYKNKPYSPVNLYAATKYAFQNILQYYAEAKRINTVTLKLFDLYGPNDPRPKLLNLLLKTAATGETLAMSPGEQKIDLVHIKDIVGAYLVSANRLLEGKVKGHEIYAVASGNALSLRSLVALLEENTKRKINIDWGGRPYKSREMMTPYPELASLPGWDAKISLAEGIRSLTSLRK